MLIFTFMSFIHESTAVSWNGRNLPKIYTLYIDHVLTMNRISSMPLWRPFPFSSSSSSKFSNIQPRDLCLYNIFQVGQ
ncbi:hypothetical protein BJ912DRAFT_1008153 [Pholiota molesta]|nr:hypothetical protein BJ912DRAFT_1008153 [Pholiota molesta]